MASSKPMSFKMPSLSFGFAPKDKADQTDPKMLQGYEGLLAEYKPERGNWADAAGLLGGILMDLDGTMGTGNREAVQENWKQHVENQRGQFEAKQNKKLLAAAAGGDDFAIRLMDPLGARRQDIDAQWRQEDIDREGAYRTEDIEREDLYRKQDLEIDATRWAADDAYRNRVFEEEKRRFGLQYAQDQEKLRAENAKAGLPDPEDEGQLRKEYLARNKDFITVQQAYGKIRALDTTTAPGQMGLVFSVMKLYDPSSSVRESEYANAENAAGVPAQIRNQWNKLKDGTFLDTTQINEFVRSADELYGAAASDFELSYETYRNQIAPGYGFDPDRTVPDLRDPKLAPADGETEFAGGDKLPRITSTTGIKINPVAMQELLRNPTPAEMAEFDAAFGKGSAKLVLEANKVQPVDTVRPGTDGVARMRF